MKKTLLGLALLFNLALADTKQELTDNEILKAIKLSLPTVYETIQTWAKQNDIDPNSLSNKEIEKFATSEEFGIIYKEKLNEFCIDNPKSCACTECK